MRYITFTNKGSLEICKNFLLSARNVGIEQDITVYTLDEDSMNELQGYNCKLESFSSDINEEYHSYGSKEFKTLMTTKVEIILKNLEEHDEFVYTDCDMVLLDDPTGLLNVYNEMVSKEYDWNIAFADDALEENQGKETLCAGFMYVKNREETKKFLEKTLELSILAINDNDPDTCDQIIMRNLLSGPYRERHGIPNFVHAILPLTFVTNGHFYFSQKIRRNESVVHCNFRMGTEDKINSMKEAGLWYLPEHAEV